MMKRLLFYFYISLVNAYVSNAQFNWPEDRATAEEKNALYTDYLEQNKLREAVPHLQWLIANAPDLNKSIYQNGAKIYQELAKSETDETQKQIYVDSALQMYDQRMKYFGDEVNVLNRKATQAYIFQIRNKKKFTDLMDLFEDVYKISGNNVHDGNLIAYMNIVKVNAKALKNLTEDQIFDKYDQIIGVIDFKVAQNKNVEKLEKQRTTITNILLELVEVNCEFIENKLLPKYKESPNNLKLTKRIFALSLSSKCTDATYFVNVAKNIFAQEPDYGIAWAIGNKCLVAEDYQCAVKYLNEAMKLTDDNTKIADLYYKLAGIAVKEGQKSKAREYALKTVNSDPSRKDAYNLIAILYSNSYNDCRKGEDKVKDRLVFLAAYAMYRKAGNAKGMESAKIQFPSKEELFERDYERGSTMNTGCWINQPVALQTRD